MPGQRIAADAGVLRKGTQRLLQREISREAGIRQLESGGDDRRIREYGTDRRTQKRSVDGPVFGIELVEVLALLQLDSVIGVEAGAQQRIRVEASFQCEIVVVEVAGLAGLAALERRASVNSYGRIDMYRPGGVHQVGSNIETVFE